MLIWKASTANGGFTQYTTALAHLSKHFSSLHFTLSDQNTFLHTVHPNASLSALNLPTLNAFLHQGIIHYPHYLLFLSYTD